MVTVEVDCSSLGASSAGGLGAVGSAILLVQGESSLVAAAARGLGEQGSRYGVGWWTWEGSCVGWGEREGKNPRGKFRAAGDLILTAASQSE